MLRVRSYALEDQLSLSLVWDSVLFPLVTIRRFYPVSHTRLRRPTERYQGPVGLILVYWGLYSPSFSLPPWFRLWSVRSRRGVPQQSVWLRNMSRIPCYSTSIRSLLGKSEILAHHEISCRAGRTRRTSHVMLVAQLAPRASKTVYKMTLSPKTNLEKP